MSGPHKGPVEPDGVIMPLDIQSPVILIRMKKGLSQAEIGVVLNVSEKAIELLETGECKMTKRVQEGLTELGFDGAELANEQEEFIEKKRKWLLGHLRDNL